MIGSITEIIRVLGEKRQLLSALLVLLGLTLVVLGASGGIAKYGVTLPDASGRVAVAGVGAVVVVVGLILAVAAQFKVEDKRAWINKSLPKFNIDRPSIDSHIMLPCRVDGRGETTPRGTLVYWFTMIGDGHWPQGQIRLSEGKWDFELLDAHFGDSDHVRIGIFLVGQDGNLLIDHYKYVSQHIRDAREKYKVSVGTPGLLNLPSDIKLISDDRRFFKANSHRAAK